MEYVVGLMFNDAMDKITLIRKQKPSWQYNKLNGIGGKIEPNELEIDAMVREFREETSVTTTKEDWFQFCNMSGKNNDNTPFKVYFFYTVGDLSNIKSNEIEKVEIHDVDHICTNKEDTIGNIPWIILLAKDIAKGVYPPSIINVIY